MIFNMTNLVYIIEIILFFVMLKIVLLAIKREFAEPKNDWQKLLKEKEKRDLKEQKNKKTIKLKGDTATMTALKLKAENNTLKMEQKQILEKVENLEKKILENEKEKNLKEKEKAEERKRKYISNIEKGKKYEYQIMQYFKNLKYGVYPKPESKSQTRIASEVAIASVAMRGDLILYCS